ncbi:MAG: hypothetical protein WC523_04135 [Patescibacteria group bacterium]
MTYKSYTADVTSIRHFIREWQDTIVNTNEKLDKAIEILHKRQ